MGRTSAPAPPVSAARAWAPSLADLRLVGDGRSVAVLSPAAEVLWWCAPEFDDQPLCWRLLDVAGGTARFPHLDQVQHEREHEHAPAGASATTLLRDETGEIEVIDSLLTRGEGLLLVRLLRCRGDHCADRRQAVEHELSLGGFDASPVTWTLDGDTAAGTLDPAGRTRSLRVRGGRQEVRGGTLVSRLDLLGREWTALVIGVDAEPVGAVSDLLAELGRRDVAEQRRLAGCRVPQSHPQRALDALAVIRACTSQVTGAVVAAPTTSLPEAPGHDRQFDYRYTWLRDASLSTAVASLLGQGVDARRYLDFVHHAWDDRDLLTEPVLDVRGGDVPTERDVDGVDGWAGSRPVRVGNGASGQRQYDALGLFVEAVSVYVQVGGPLDDRTWDLVRRLADQIADDDPDQVRQSNGIWELREPQPLVDGDIGRWLVLDRAMWIARGWRPWTRRRRWKRARDTIRDRILDALDEHGQLPQAYGQDPPVPDASALTAVAFGLLKARDPRASRLVDGLLGSLGSGPYVYRYPPGDDDGFSGVEGAFLPMSFLAVTALAKLGRPEQARDRLDALCAALPRLLAEEVDPSTGQMLGNTPLVWSHAELARAVYVLDAARRRERWGAAGLWAWRLQRYVRLRHDLRSDQRTPADPRPERSPYLDARRRTALLQTAAAATLAVVNLYQLGVLRAVPEPSLPGLGAEQATRHKKVCSWCTVSAGLLLATVPAVLPEARAAWRAWRER
jgi:hypothetical protein